MKRLLILSAVLLSAAAVAAQRLPGNVIPSHYTLKLTPDLANATFAGDETIDVSLSAPTAAITLNALELTFDTASISAAGASQPAKVTLDAQQQTATLTLPKPLPKGPAQIRIRYRGVLNDKMRGFYLSRAEGHRYAVTQFESTDARRAFPSFDEPAYKATFDITVVAPSQDMVISNGHIVSDQPGPAPQEHTVRFSTTPKMSTYLVAVLVGEFECIHGAADGIPVRVCAVPGKQQLGRFALGAAEHFLTYYDHYFSTKYPYGKLDLIGVPDFSAGAMENTATITFRDVLLLTDEKQASVRQLKEISLVIAHEMSHQWFGDLVTMRWWNDIWLNEGFATWMESKAVAAWKPAWHLDLDEQVSADQAMTADSLHNTRPIRQQAETPAQIEELFDLIAYNKTAAVLRMVEAYLTPPVFEQGINRYLQAHEYANATAQDFWNALAATSSKPVDRIMMSFVDNAGVPLVTPRCAGNDQMQLTQSRFSYEPLAAATNEIWTIPVCLTSGAGSPECELLQKNQQPFKVAACASFADVNAGALGYYRSGYSRQAMIALAPHIESELSPVERLAMVDNEWALVRAGSHGIDTFMDLAGNMGGERTAETMNQLGTHLRYISDYLLSDADRQPYEAWVRNLLEPAIRDLGWTAAPNDSDERRALRAAVFFTLGYSGNDPQAFAEADKLLHDYTQNPASVDPTELDAVFALAAIHGTPALYDQLLARAQTASTPDVYYRYLLALSYFRQPQLVERTLDYALSPKVRSQDAPLLVAAVLHNPAPAQQVAWNFVRSHWPQLQAKSGMWGAAIVVHATGRMCSATDQTQVNQFFTAHPVPMAQRGLKQSLEEINDCVSLRSAQQPKLASFLQQKHAAAVGQ